MSAGYRCPIFPVSQRRPCCANLFYGPVLKGYTTDLLMFVAFAALGVFGTVRRLLGARKAF